jgi:hypothetical protein
MGANFSVQPRYPYMGRGLIRSLFILVWEVLYQIFMEGLHGRILLDQVYALTRSPGWAKLEAPERKVPYPGL